MSLALRLVAHRLPHTASCVCVCAHSAPESNTASSSLRSGNFKTPFSWAVGLGKNVKCNIPDSENLHADSMYPWGSFHCAALFCPATAAVCLDKTFWHSTELTAWIRLWHTSRSTLSCPQDSWAWMRARTQWRWAQNTVPSPFQVSSLWRSGGWVQEDDSNPQRLLLVRPETRICRALQIPSRPRRLPKASLWFVNRDWQRHDAGRQTV